ncbi:MAG: NADH-quinone oxidoreductase subunit C [Gammaproteobacteria bacterium]|nr:NADH-quinone oxidoreductase subunit C [Gammaproteobacteria bacterium]
MLTDLQASTLSALLHERLGAQLQALTVDRGELTAVVAAADISAVGQILRDAPDLSFRLLVDLSGVDYQTYGQTDWATHEATSAGFSRGVAAASAAVPEAATPGRFAVVYHLLSTAHNRRVRLKVWLAEDPPRLPSVTEIWPCADWYEREAFDLFGILFEGHPDLRRLLTDYGFIGHPFRKDFPLEGYVEVRYDAQKQRVVYQPVSIESRVLVPRVIRGDPNKGH